jgi:hypothetical protein
MSKYCTTHGYAKFEDGRYHMTLAGRRLSLISLGYETEAEAIEVLENWDEESRQADEAEIRCGVQ